MSKIEIAKGTNSNYTSIISIDKDNNIVEKTIDYETYSRELFDRELYWLKKLEYADIAPKVIKSDSDNFVITMDWCGDILSNDNKPDNVFEQLYNINIILLKNNCFYNDWKFSNFLVKDGKIKIIDFGWCPKIIEDYSCGDVIYSELKEKPGGGNLFLDILNNIKLLDLNNEWRQARPGLEYDEDSLIITGYQSYKINSMSILPTSENTQIKHNLIIKNIVKDVNGKSVADVGCSNMYFGFLSYFYGAKNVIGVDLDKEYIELNNNIIDLYSMSNVSCINVNAVDFKKQVDTVFAFAIIHWVYSCSGFLGSLKKVIEHFRLIVKDCLYIEWIDPEDDCIEYFHHLDYNKDYVVRDYNKDNFLKYLNNNFSSVEYLGNSKISREIYRCLI